MRKRPDHQDTGPAEAAGPVPTRLLLGKPRPGHGTLYVNPAGKKFADSEWHASWQDDYPESQTENNGGASAGVECISGSEEDVLRWARTRQAKKHLIMEHGKWIPLPLDEGWRPE